MPITQNNENLRTSLGFFMTNEGYDADPQVRPILRGLWGVGRDNGFTPTQVVISG